MGKVICCRCLEPREIGKSVIVLDGCTAYMCLDCMDEYCQLSPLLTDLSREAKSEVFKQFCKGSLVNELERKDELMLLLPPPK